MKRAGTAWAKGVLLAAAVYNVPWGAIVVRLPWCCSGLNPANTWVAGQVFGVDGGLSTLRPLPRPSKSNS